jgi:hypothetical protein
MLTFQYCYAVNILKLNSGEMQARFLLDTSESNETESGIMTKYKGNELLT